MTWNFYVANRKSIVCCYTGNCQRTSKIKEFQVILWYTSQRVFRLSKFKREQMNFLGQWLFVCMSKLLASFAYCIWKLSNIYWLWSFWCAVLSSQNQQQIPMDRIRSINGMNEIFVGFDWNVERVVGTNKQKLKTCYQAREVFIIVW